MFTHGKGNISVFRCVECQIKFLILTSVVLILPPVQSALPTGARPTYTLTFDLFSNVVSAHIDRNIKHKPSCFKTPEF